MGWKTATERYKETEKRLLHFRKQKMCYGVPYLDRALGGIYPIDLILVGAASGAGKTGFVTNLALANARLKRNVHVIALECYEGEIEDRIHYQRLADLFYSDSERVRHVDFTYTNWREGLLQSVEHKYKQQLDEEFNNLGNLKTFYLKTKFTIEDFIRQAFLIEEETDLLIIDHVHYFDIEDQNENRGLRAIIKEIRNIQTTINKPIVLVSHLRKVDKKNPEVCAGIDEFHGSSDLTKIATQVITLGRGEMITPNSCETFIRIPKNRWDGSVTFYCGKIIYSIRKNCYEDHAQIGRLIKGGTKWEPIPEELMPKWATKKLTPSKPLQSLHTSLTQTIANSSTNQDLKQSSEKLPGF